MLSLSGVTARTYKPELHCFETYRAEFARKGIALTEELAQGSKFTVFADQQRLYQLFCNLLDNSLKYTGKGGELVIRLACNSGQVAIDFEDSAPGVPESELDRLFDRLYRVEGSRNRSSGGAGLGLAICRNIVEAHAGTIAARPPQLGGGC